MTEIYDLECLSNLFTYTGYNYKENKWSVFVISKWRNDADGLKKHLSELKLMIGFNNEKYDYPLLHHFINHYDEYPLISGEFIARDLYAKSQEIIDAEFSSIADKNKFIPQIDLFLIFGYNNKARSTSLKDLEFGMRMENVEEMPIRHNHWCNESDEKIILEYNKNDVWATYLFYKITRGETDNPIYKGKDKIELRLRLQKKFKLPCINYPDVKMGEQLILSLYCKETKRNKYDIKKSGGTKREKINLGECIPHWADFKSKEFNKIKDEFKNTTITSIKGAFESSVIFHNFKLDYGTGGIHGCIKPGIYEANDYWMILDEDIGLITAAQLKLN